MNEKMINNFMIYFVKTILQSILSDVIKALHKL